MKLYLRFFIILTIVLLLGCNPPDPEISRPNLLYIIVDEMREMAMSCSGDPNINTPGLDSLAAQGMRFTRMYTPNPVCSPARASIHTGLYPHNAGMPHNGYHLRETAPTLAEVLQQAGYTTGHIGKWHLNGEPSTTSREDKESYKLIKKEWSVDSYYGYVDPESHRGFEYWAGFEHGHQYFGSRYWEKEYKPILLPEGEYEPDVQTDLAIQFIKNNRSENWYLDLNYGTPHFPLVRENAKAEDLALFDTAKIILRPNVPPQFANEARESLAIYYAMIHNLDENIQKLMKALKEEGLFENTLIIFTSDHGDMMLSHGQHYKRRPQEESSRVPFIVCYPPAVKPGLVSERYLNLVDIYPSILEMLNVDAPPNEGLSFSPLLKGISDEEIHSSIYMGSAWFGGRDYDLGLHAKSPWRAVRTKDHMMAFLKTSDSQFDAIQLFDMNADPFQMNNLVDDPAYIDIKKVLTEELDAWRRKTGDAEVQKLKLPDWE